MVYAYCEELFQVLEARTYTAYSFRVTDKTVEVRFVVPHSSVMLSFYTKAIQHLAQAVQAADLTDLVIWVAEKAGSGLHLPQPFWNWNRISRYGLISGFSEEDYYANYDLSTHTFTLLERSRKRAVVWMQDFTLQPEWMSSFPFRTLWFEWLKAYGYLFVHAGAVGLQNGKGVLLTGRGGAGKSTSTLACLESRLLYAGDDFVAVHSTTRRVYSLYNVAKLEQHQFARFPHLEQIVYNPQTMHKEKGQIFLADHFPEKLAITFQIEAVLLPRFTGQPHTHIRPATTAESWRALVPSTVELLHLNQEYTQALGGFLRQFPSYWLETGTDLKQISFHINHILTSSC